VLGEAMRQCREWHAAGRDLAVSVNLSMRNLHDPQFPGTVGALLMNWQVDPQAIVLEITESAVMADSERALAVLQQLRGMGVRLSIDDFGTGYSSLSYLKRMPVSEIKIDKSFVTDMHTNDDDAIIVRSTIDLAHNLGLTVTAEGVEREDAFTVLNVLGCDLAQGHYISPALPVRELEEWLSRSAWGRAADRPTH
jgi:EAL domain-containing protein (putative c-di-GMP-specific phosphodiesterase class I)